MWEWKYNSSIRDIGRFTLGERAPVNHQIGGWVGPTVAMDALELERNLLPPVVQTVTIPTELLRLNKYEVKSNIMLLTRNMMLLSKILLIHWV
jgi:hypothetical protein